MKVIVSHYSFVLYKCILILTKKKILVKVVHQVSVQNIFLEGI